MVIFHYLKLSMVWFVCLVKGKEVEGMYEVSEGGGWLFTAVPVLVIVGFVIVFLGIIGRMFNGLSEWKKNEESPRLSVPAMVKTKRVHVTRHSHSHDDHTASSTTTYFVTFEFESGDRSEFRISGKEYGVLAEGDTGILTFQGTRYIDFVRKRVLP
ncbi:uncharacterized protein DUF2500 [Bacillus badius]|nr:uncharacterized protein DUF2500 [Bacillus badius]